MKPSISDATFPVTRWSVVAQLEEGDRDEQRALEELCLLYRAPLYAFARHRGQPPADAEDLVQGFLLKASTNGLFQRADEERGRLRTFLITAFRRYMRDEWEKATAEKRGGGKTFSLDAADLETWYEAEGAALDSPESAYDRRWAVSVLESSLARLRGSWERRGHADHFDQLRPFLTATGTAADHARIGAQIDASPNTVKVKIHRLRAKFAGLLREEVALTLVADDNVDDELRYLIELL